MTATTCWPALPVAQWHATRDTLQLWLQIIGKIRLANSPLQNHWWNVPSYVTARGLTTSLMHHEAGESFQIDLDLHDHALRVVTAHGKQRSFALRTRPIPDFYAELTALLEELGVATPIWPMPVEIAGAVPFDQDVEHGTYDPDQAHRFWLALVAMVRVFETFRTDFVGKASPVHLFWGGLDLATTRFSGRGAPPHPGGAPNCGPHVMREAYSQEVSSVGYWPAGAEEGVFYSYAYPEPPGFAATQVGPEGASWSEELREFVLPYALVRTSADPEGTLLAFLQSTYEAAATTARWDRAHLERPPLGPRR